MRGDFSRVSFDPMKAFTRVLEQQGRVQLDADRNEQVDIFWRYLRTLAVDLMGPHGGPTANDFAISVIRSTTTGPIVDLGIGFGRYYVQGILCENPTEDACGGPHDPVTYFGQPYFSRETKNPDLQLPTEFPWMVYLDVWERHITTLEDDQIREVALLGPDTSTRAQAVWQVRVARPPEGVTNCAELTGEFIGQAVRPDRKSCLTARAKPGAASPDACILPPNSRYRGFENQLYRVEIHRGGTAGTATYKWSRENGSVVFPIDEETNGSVIRLKNLGRDSVYSLEKGDQVEVVNDDMELEGRVEDLLQVLSVDPEMRQVTLSAALDASIDLRASKHPLLRRWDQRSRGAAALTGSALIVQEGTYLELEDQVEIQFAPGGRYYPGDYWLIPARVATGDVIWPRTITPSPDGDVVTPLPRPPQGVPHAYAPLALVNADGTVTSCRAQIYVRP